MASALADGRTEYLPNSRLEQTELVENRYHDDFGRRHLRQQRYDHVGNPCPLQQNRQDGGEPEQRRECEQEGNWIGSPA